MPRIVKCGLIQTSLAAPVSEPIEKIRDAQTERTVKYIDQAGQQGVQVLCMQEIKASPEHVPPELSLLDGYWGYWHGHKGYSGVSLHLRKSAFPRKPHFEHPEFDHENRIVTARSGDALVASIYVPNGNKDYPAKVRFLEALAKWAGEKRSTTDRMILCGDLNVAARQKLPRECLPDFAVADERETHYADR